MVNGVGVSKDMSSTASQEGVIYFVSGVTLYTLILISVTNKANQLARLTYIRHLDIWSFLTQKITKQFIKQWIRLIDYISWVSVTCYYAVIIFDSASAVRLTLIGGRKTIRPKNIFKS